MADYGVFEGLPVAGMMPSPRTGGPFKGLGKGLKNLGRGLGRGFRGGDVATIQKRVDKLREKLAAAEDELAQAQAKAGGAPAGDDSEETQTSSGIVVGRMW